MTRESGSFCVRVEFDEWAVERETILAETSRNELGFRFAQSEDGRVSFTLSDARGEVFAIRTQRFKFDKAGAVLLVANWNAAEKCIYANGKKLLSADETTEIALVSADGRSRIVDGPISFQQPDCRTACSPWMKWRAENYGTTPMIPRPGRRAKTVNEQMSELERSHLLLRDLISRAEAGADHVVGAIAAELRALVFWPPKPNRNYNPLLLRLAARRNLPLPIWAFVVRGFAEKPLKELGSFAHTLAVVNVPDIRKSQDGQKLIDLQAWLDDPFQLNAEGEGMEEFGKICVTHKNLIHQIASIIGTSHYDADIPTELDTFRNFFGDSGRVMAQMLVHVAKSVHDLAAYLMLECAYNKVPEANGS